MVLFGLASISFRRAEERVGRADWSDAVAGQQLVHQRAAADRTAHDRPVTQSR